MENTPADNTPIPTPTPTDAQQTIETPAATTPSQPVAAVAVPNRSIKKLLPLFIIGILAILVGAILYYLFIFESPAKIASRAEDVNGAFVKYSRAVKRVSKHLEEDAGGSADALERYAAQGEDLLKEARNARVDLDKELRNAKAGKLNNYIQNLNDYLKKADEMIAVEEENIKLSKASVRPSRMYEDLTVDLSGAGNYMISDTKKYAQIMVDSVAKAKEINKLFQQIEVGDPFEKYNEYTVNSLKLEIKYLESLLTAVENRDSDALVTASQVYAQDMQRNSSDASRESDKINSQIKELNQKLEELKEDVEAEYSNLKSEYKF